jgi:hypothetical protein
LGVKGAAAFRQVIVDSRSSTHFGISLAVWIKLPFIIMSCSVGASVFVNLSSQERWLLGRITR